MDSSMIGDWYSLTEEEQYELYHKFEHADEWLYEDYPDPNSPDGIALHKYYVEQAQFMADAMYYYKKYLDYKGEKKPSPGLLCIFKYNIKLLNFFLNRIKEGDKKGTEIIIEFQAIMELQKGLAYKLVDDSKKLEPLRVALFDMGFVTRNKSNWSDGFGKKHQRKLGAIVEEYQAFIERDQ